MSVRKEIGQELDRLRFAILNAEEKLASLPTSEGCWVGIDEEQHALVFTDWNGSMKLCVAEMTRDGFRWVPDLSSAKPLLEISIKARKEAAELIPDLIAEANGELANFGKDVERVAEAIEAAIQTA
ncbi:MAG: hypothetical protein ACK5N9_11495 [Pirellula sp.]